MALSCINHSIHFKLSSLPKSTKYEIALIGYSNVGKSSLINGIFKTKLAYVSKKPGRTQGIGIYEYIHFALVDLPGYGYAEFGDAIANNISDIVHGYFASQRCHELWLLLDTRRGFRIGDRIIYESAKKTNMNIKLIGTKGDKKEKAIQAYDHVVSYKDSKTLCPLRSYLFNLKSSSTFTSLNANIDDQTA